MFLLPFIIWGMAEEGGWNVLWMFPVWLIAMIVYTAAFILVFGSLALGATWIGEHLPYHVKSVFYVLGVIFWAGVSGSLFVGFCLLVASSVISVF